MDKVKEVLKDNIPIIVVAVVVILIAVIYKVVTNYQDSQIYYSGIMTNENVVYEPKKYSENEYRVIEVDKENVALNYYKVILNMMINDREALWNKLTVDERKSYLNDFKKFDSEIGGRVSRTFYNNTVTKFSFEEKSSTRTIYIVDTDNYMYKIYEKGVWNFEIELMGFQDFAQE